LAAATIWARRGRLVAPDDEVLLRRLIQLLDRTGDRGGALRVYEEFAEWLRREYETEPAPETQRLVAEVRAQAYVPPLANDVPRNRAPAALDPGPPNQTVEPGGERRRLLAPWAARVLAAGVLVGVGLASWLGLGPPRPSCVRIDRIDVED